MARILAIDDDNVVLVAIVDLLEESGHQVFTQLSPIGATQVILREKIDVAVIDINLPVMQGDNVIRLLRSWDKIRDLPILIVSGAEQQKLEQIQKELPGVKIVRKDEMHRALAGAVREALAAVRPRATSAVAAPSGATATDQGMPPAEVTQRFLEQLVALMKRVNYVWDEVQQGRVGDVPMLTESFTTLRGQGQLLGLPRVANLLAALQDFLQAGKPGLRVPREAAAFVDSAIASLRALRDSPSKDLVLSPEPLIKALKRATDELRSK